MTRKTSPKVASIAAKGLNDPDSLTDSEVQSLSASALSQVEPDPETEQTPAERLVELKRLLAKRRGVPGYAANVAEIEAEIGRLSGMSAVP